MNSNLYFDIETSCLPDDQLALLMPEFKAPANYKAPEKIKANIAEQAVAWKERGALDAVTGRIVAIGIIENGVFQCMIEDDEKTLIQQFWTYCIGHKGFFVGFNSHRFDWPFIFRRGFKHGIRPPFTLRRGFYWNELTIDLMESWQLGDRQNYISLDTLAKHLGVGAKNGDGAQFAELLKTDREKAIAYLRNDLELLKLIAERIL